MSWFEIEIDQQGLKKTIQNVDRFEKKWINVRRQALNETAEVIRDLLRANMPIITGNGRRSVSINRPSELERIIGHDKDLTRTEDNRHSYMNIVFYGIKKGYFIYPVKAQALRFEIGGKTIFAKRVFIPPRPGKDFITPTVQEASARQIGEKVFALTFKQKLNL